MYKQMHTWNVIFIFLFLFLPLEESMFEKAEQSHRYLWEMKQFRSIVSQASWRTYLNPSYVLYYYSLLSLRVETPITGIVLKVIGKHMRHGDILTTDLTRATLSNILQQQKKKKRKRDSRRKFISVALARTNASLDNSLGTRASCR